jgi:serine protease Do
MNNNDFENRDQQNNEIGEEMRNDPQNDTYSQEVSQQDNQGIQEKDKAVEAEAPTVSIEGQGFGEESASSSGEAKAVEAQNVTGTVRSEGRTTNNTASTNTINAQRYSFGYVPPYYGQSYGTAPNGGYGYGAYGNGAASGANKQDKKKKFGSGIVIALGVVCALLAISTVAMMAMFILGDNAAGFIPDSNETLQVQQGNKDITIIENDSNNKDMSVVEIAALVGESVVEITTTHVQSNGYFGGQYITSGAGSGVFFSQTEKYGYIVTNYHVIEGANDITVRVKDGNNHKNYTAEYVGGDATEDIAVIRIVPAESEKFTLAVFRDYKSSPLQVGEDVVAIGNPLGSLGGTVTNGILSALDREIIIENNAMTLLQTNAAINPGNSGGGLFDSAGNLIGIVNAKQSAEGIEGLGFAIPSNRVLEVIDDILNLGYVSGRATLGIEVQYGSYGTNYWNKQTGVFVVDVGDTSFEKYDRVIAINGAEISSLAQYNATVKSLTIGEKAKVTVVRNGSEKEITVTVKEDTTKS